MHQLLYTKGTLLGVALLALTLLPTPPAYAQDMSPELEEYKAICWDDVGWLKTDGCIESAEALGLEIDNLIESDRKGCSAAQLYEDFSCEGLEGPSPSSSSEAL